VHAAASGKQALEQLRTSLYDVIVCDVGMDEMDGLEFTRIVRSRPETRELPILLVSALDSEAERARGLDAGANGFLSKRDCVSGRLLGEVAALTSRAGGTP
jgi:two-component system, chemotaxis family, sensor kinase CheA